MIRTRRRGLAILGLVVMVLSACGQGSGMVSEVAAARLEPQVQAVRQAAVDRRPGLAADEVTHLRELVAELSSAGEIDAAAVQRILSAADDVQAGLGLLDSPGEPTPPTSAAPAEVPTTVAPTTTVAPDDEADDASEDEKPQDEKEQKEEDEEDKDETEPPGNARGRPGAEGTAGGQ